jgi:nitric oxide reductase subunit B
MLFCLKGLAARNEWKEGTIRFAFWAINLGLAAMAFISVLPVGFLQTMASVEHGMWYARSAEFMQTPLMHKLRWSRVIGDTIFASGTIALAVFVAGLKFGFSLKKNSDVSEENYPTAGK